MDRLIKVSKQEVLDFLLSRKILNDNHLRNYSQRLFIHSCTTKGKPALVFNYLILELILRDDYFLEFDSLYDYLSEVLDFELEIFENMVNRKCPKDKWKDKNWRL